MKRYVRLHPHGASLLPSTLRRREQLKRTLEKPANIRIPTCFLTIRVESLRPFGPAALQLLKTLADGLDHRRVAYNRYLQRNQ